MNVGRHNNMSKNLKSDKFVVYVLPASTTEPLLKVFKCDNKGKITEELTKGGFYIEDYAEVGKLIIDNSKNVDDFKKAKSKTHDK